MTRSLREVVFVDGVRTPFGKAGPKGMYALHEAFPDRFAVGDGLRRMVELGKPSVFSEPGVVDPELAGAFGTGTGGPDAEELRANAERALAEEITLMLDEGVVQAVEDIDLAMLLGAGWPFWLGGISPYLKRVGAL